jgi:hypothetical protein
MSRGLMCSCSEFHLRRGFLNVGLETASDNVICIISIQLDCQKVQVLFSQPKNFPTIRLSLSRSVGHLLLCSFKIHQQRNTHIALDLI